MDWISVAALIAGIWFNRVQVHTNMVVYNLNHQRLDYETRQDLLLSYGSLKRAFMFFFIATIACMVLATSCFSFVLYFVGMQWYYFVPLAILYVCYATVASAFIPLYRLFPLLLLIWIF